MNNKDILKPEGFENIKWFDDVLPEIDMWNGENVLFCRERKVFGEMNA
ncbi:hypothetical protein [Methanolobus psychrotolerans]|nr:hypothetical protein [Methanolobus psychrotolerans]